MGDSVADRKKETTSKRRTRASSGAGRFSPWLLLPVILVLGLRFWAVTQLEESPLLATPQLEDASYLAEARDLNRPSEMATERLPRGSALYTRIVAAAFEDGGTPALPYVQIVVEVLTTLLLATWIRRRFGTLAGVSAGVFYALDPLGGFFAARLIPTTWATLTFLAAIVTLDGDRQARSSGRGLVFGILTAIGFAFSPLLFLILALVATFDRFRSDPTDAVGQKISWTAAAVVPLIIVLSLTLARHDSMRGGGPTLSWGSGISIHQAASGDHGGTPRALTRPSWKPAGSWQSEAWESLQREGTLYEFSSYYRSSGLRRWIEQPIETIGLLLVKTAATLGSWPIPDALSATFLFAEDAPFFRYGAFTFALWLGLGLAGWWSLRSRFPEAASIFALGAIVVGLTALLGTTSAASRHPALPLLAGLGGVFLGQLFGSKTEPRAGSSDSFPGRPTPLAFALLGLGVVVSLAAGFLSPTRAIDDKSEEFRLVSNALIANEDWDAATRAGETAVRLAPENVAARVSLSRLYQRDGLVRAAEEQLQAAYAADSTHVPTLLALSGLEQERGNIDRAIVLATRLVVERPNNPLYLNELGQLYLRTQRIGNARGLFLRALEIKPDYRVAQANLETVVRYERDLERQLYPDDMQLPEGDPLTGQIEQVIGFMQEGNWTSADSLLHVAESSRPDHILGHFMRAGYHARRGEDDEAIAKLEFCHELAPCRIAVVQRLTTYYVDRGQNKRAKDLVRGCIDGLPDDDSLRGQWSALEESLAAAP